MTFVISIRWLNRTWKVFVNCNNTFTYVTFSWLTSLFLFRVIFLIDTLPYDLCIRITYVCSTVACNFLYKIVAFLDTHALIHFDKDNSSSIVPLSRVQREEENLHAGNLCTVLWSNKKYAGKLICSGKYIIA